MSWKRDIVLFKQEGVYACFPLLQQLPDGRLVVGFTHRDWPTHCDPGRWRVLISADGGESWRETHDTSLQLLWRGSGYGFRCVLPDGTHLIVGAGGWEARPMQERTQWEAQGYFTRDHETDATLFYLARRNLHVERSRDGQTWQRQTIPAPEVMLTLNGFHDEGLRLQDGTLLVPAGGEVSKSGLDLRTREGRTSRNYMARSTDDGESWDLVQLMEDPQGQYTNEVAFLEVSEGRVLALARVQGPGRGYLWQQWSADGGQSWSGPVETRIWGYPAHLLKLQDGRVLCSYGYRRIPPGIRAVVSHNGGWSWEMADERVLRDDGGTPAQGWSAEMLERFKKEGLAGADLGYPRSTQLADGTILTVYYITTADGITHVAATKWRVDGDL